MRASLLHIPRSVRFALFYGAFYLGFGAYLPYMPVWFEGRGLSPELIGLAAGAGMAGRIIAAPLAVSLADLVAKRRHAILIFSVASLFVFLAHIPANSPVLIVILSGLAGCTVTGIIPIIDSWAIRESTRRRFAFGPPRAFGSATFIIGNIGGGAAVGYFGGEAALYWLLLGCGLSIAAAASLPEGRRQPVKVHPPRGEVLKVIAANGLPIAFAASALLQGAHGFYYGFSAIAWTGIGISPDIVGYLWATGVGAEVLFFALVSRYFSNISPAGLMVLGGVASVMRWIAFSLSPPLWALFMLQGLHAFGFGASYLGFLRYATEAAPERYGATIQAVNSALSGGVVLAAATYASGFAYAHMGVAGFAIMAIPAGLGLVCALKLALSRNSTFD